MGYTGLIMEPANYGGFVMKKEQTFFDFAAEVGLTKHLGGAQATERLATLCHISKDKYILDVGCGAGVTPSYLAKRYGCNIVGVDIVPAMIERSKQRARKEGLADLIEFRVADAQNLPFEDNTFDAVITESVTAFPADKQQAVNEYVRVTKPGGYIGLNESTWLKTPPPPEMLAWASQDLGATVNPLSKEEWKTLLERAGLAEIAVYVDKVDTKDETRGILQRYGCGGMLTILWRTFKMYLRNPAYRCFVKRVRADGITPKNLEHYFGYGFYVGKKPISI
jgi:ubiquinone/menaquinone biosynthesis C-methylase UbiE